VKPQQTQQKTERIPHRDPTQPAAAIRADTRLLPRADPGNLKVGEKVRDDNYQFTVTKVTYGVKRVGDSYLGEKAQGQFCLVKMRLKAATTS
jgi:hypothetical protein